jgi:Ca-activated chloride channel homolog
MPVRRMVESVLVACAALCSAGIPSVQAQIRSQTSIAVDVDLVQIPVVIFDQKGGVATNLEKSDFRLFDDGIEQRILYFDKERVPVSFVILADLSSSMTAKIPFVREATASLLDSPEEENQYRDEYSIVEIGKRPKTLLAFTHDQQDLEKRLPFLLTDTNESTALLDGIWLGVRTAREEAINRHRAMVIITDGGDNHSRYNLKETRSLLEEADLPVFAVMAGPSFELPKIFRPYQKKRDPFPWGKQSGPQFPDLPFAVSGKDYIGPAERRGPHNMKELTEVTGGGVFTARHEEDLARIVGTIGLAVRYRYVLTYKPVHGDGFPHTVQNVAGKSVAHKVYVQLYPPEKFKGYSFPYYKRSYHSRE